MPPKIKITKEDITNGAIALVRESGADALNARALASTLACSTQPIFSNFSDMNKLTDAVIEKAYKIYLTYLENEAESGKYPKYKAFGMAYIRFAKEEKELFKLLFMRDRSAEEKAVSPDFLHSVEINMQALGLAREKAELFHLEMWAFVHGIAVMLATSFLELDEGLIARMSSDVYMGLSKKYLNEV